MATANLLLPIKLDAFILNSAVCDGGKLDSKISPITQPNYTYLRIDENAARTDVLPHVDLHLSSPSTKNPRITNLSTRQTLPGRQGVYLHWTIPKLYRGASTSDDSSTAASGTTGAASDTNSFPLVPNRWMVVRRLHLDSYGTASISPIEAWVVESDRLFRIDELDSSVDLQTDVSPFMDITAISLDANGKPTLRTDPKNDPLSNVSIADQAEMFIGTKTPNIGVEGISRKSSTTSSSCEFKPVVCGLSTS